MMLFKSLYSNAELTRTCFPLFYAFSSFNLSKAVFYHFIIVIFCPPVEGAEPGGAGTVLRSGRGDQPRPGGGGSRGRDQQGQGWDPRQAVQIQRRPPHGHCQVRILSLFCSVADPDPGWVKNQDPGWTTQIIFPRGFKYLNSLSWIWDPGWKKIRLRDPGREEVGSGIRDKHPGSATLLFCKIWKH